MIRLRLGFCHSQKRGVFGSLGLSWVDGYGYGLNGLADRFIDVGLVFVLDEEEEAAAIGSVLSWVCVGFISLLSYMFHSFYRRSFACPDTLSSPVFPPLHAYLCVCGSWLCSVFIGVVIVLVVRLKGELWELMQRR